VAPAPTRIDPFKAGSFLVEIDGIAKLEFTSVTGLTSETDVVEYRTGADLAVRKLPGRTQFGNLVMERGLTQDASLFNWRQSIVNGVPDRRNGTITLLDDTRQPAVRWQFSNGWPAKWEGPDFDASKNEVAIETLELAHEGITLVT
jgi:phage tail-like protein